jgi:hypothetical protein
MKLVAAFRKLLSERVKQLKVCNIINMFWTLRPLPQKFMLFTAEFSEWNVALICYSPVCHFAVLFTLCVESGDYINASRGTWFDRHD